MNLTKEDYKIIRSMDILSIIIKEPNNEVPHATLLEKWSSYKSKFYNYLKNLVDMEIIEKIVSKNRSTSYRLTSKGKEQIIKIHGEISEMYKKLFNLWKTLDNIKNEEQHAFQSITDLVEDTI